MSRGEEDKMEKSDRTIITQQLATFFLGGLWVDLVDRISEDAIIRTANSLLLLATRVSL